LLLADAKSAAREDRVEASERRVVGVVDVDIIRVREKEVWRVVVCGVNQVVGLEFVW
jgi:hypothetical protein